MSLKPWSLRNRVFEWGQQTYLMGILNVTPDSFSDGGQFNTLKAAFQQAHQLAKQGADLVDIGGQSTRPNAEEVPLQDELDRVIPVIKALRQDPAFESIPISIDTTRSQVAEAAIAAGADLVNDISGATFDPEMLPTIAKLKVPIILMHIRGTPKTMQSLTQYQDVVKEVGDFLETQLKTATEMGIDRIMIDPGIGFAKTYEQSIEILRRLGELRSLNCPILVGASRKSFIGHILNQSDPQKRVWGTAAACASAIATGADMLRIHDVAEMRDVCRVADAIWRGVQEN